MSEIIMPVSAGRIIIDGNTIRSEGLKEGCPCCGRPDCYADPDCDGAEVGEFEDQDRMNERYAANSAIDGVESLVLALVVEKVCDPSSESFKKAVTTALDAIGNNF